MAKKVTGYIKLQVPPARRILRRLLVLHWVSTA